MKHNDFIRIYFSLNNNTLSDLSIYVKDLNHPITKLLIKEVHDKTGISDINDFYYSIIFNSNTIDEKTINFYVKEINFVFDLSPFGYNFDEKKYINQPLLINNNIILDFLKLSVSGSFFNEQEHFVGKITVPFQPDESNMVDLNHVIVNFLNSEFNHKIFNTMKLKYHYFIRQAKFTKKHKHDEINIFINKLIQNKDNRIKTIGYCLNNLFNIKN